MIILSRPSIIYQLFIFSLVSPYYVHLNQAISAGETALNIKNLISFASNNYFLLALSIITALTVWKMRSYAVWLLTILVTTVVFKSMQLALIDFNKIILITSFIYIVTVYYLGMLYKLEATSAAYSPLFFQNTIGNKSDYHLRCEIKNDQGIFTGELTNWDEKSCFVAFDEGVAGLVDLTGPTQISFSFEGHDFVHHALVVSRFERGVGIRFTPDLSGNASYNWVEYFRIIDDRGYRPRSRHT